MSGTWLLLLSEDLESLSRQVEIAAAQKDCQAYTFNLACVYSIGAELIASSAVDGSTMQKS
jgi:hypothetical protein